MVILNQLIGKAGFPSPVALLKKGFWLTLLASSLGLSWQNAVLAQQPEWGQRSAVAVSFEAQPTLRDGTYLFGGIQQPEQVETEYFVFRVRSQQVVGAFYMPQSSFDCFRGNINNEQLDLKVVGYDQQAYNHAVNLNAYHSIEQVSDNDHRMLEACQADRSLAALD